MGAPKNARIASPINRAVLAGMDIIQSIEPYRDAGVPASDSGA